MKTNLILNEGIKKDRATFGDRLKELRSIYECTQSDIAEIMGVVPATVVAYEKNQKNPSIEVAVKLAGYFNASLDWLCGFTDKMARIRPMTYADILKKLVEIMGCKTDTEIHNGGLIGYDEGTGHLAGTPYPKVIGFRNSKIQNFLEEYIKMNHLLLDKTIDKDLFDMWVDKQLNQCDGASNRIVKNESYTALENDIVDKNAAIFTDGGDGVSFIDDDSDELDIENGLVTKP